MTHTLTAFIAVPRRRQIQRILAQEPRLVGLLLVEDQQQPADRIVPPLGLLPTALQSYALPVASQSTSLLAPAVAHLARQRRPGVVLLAPVPAAHVHQVLARRRLQLQTLLPGAAAVVATPTTVRSQPAGARVRGRQRWIVRLWSRTFGFVCV